MVTPWSQHGGGKDTIHGSSVNDGLKYAVLDYCISKRPETHLANNPIKIIS